MEIHIQLAGVQLGPYSEKQIREYIAEGLLSMADKARIEGSLDWIPVSELVEKLPPPAEPMPAPNPDSIFLDADPNAPKAYPAQAPAPETDSDYVSLVEPPPASTLPPKFFARREKPAPAQENPFTAKTKPLIPPTLSASGTVKTKPLGPLAPTSPVTKGKGIAASKSVSTTAPLAQATKKMSRTALARALQDTTAPQPGSSAPKSAPSTPPLAEVPAVSAVAPETTGPMASGVAEAATPVPTMPVSKKAAGLPSLLKALSAKTVPMRGAAPEAPASTGVTSPAPGTPSSGRMTMPVTTPLPTRAITNPAVNRANRQVPPPPALQATAPAPETERPTEMLPVSKKAAELRAKAAQRAAEREAAEAVPKAEAKPATKSAKESSPKAEPASETAAAPATAPAPKPERKRRSPLLLLLILCGVTAVAGGYYVWAPYHTSSALRDAMANGNSVALQKLVDFDSFRASLKQQAQQLAGSSNSPADADALNMVGKSVDAFISPDSIAGLVSKTRDAKESMSDDLMSYDVAANIVTNFVNQPLRNQGLASPTDFVLQTDVATLHLTFHGLSWQLTHIDVRSDLPVPPETAGAPLGVVPVAQTYLERGRATANAGQWAPAIANFTQALALAPQSTVAYQARADAHLARNDLDAAIKDYSQALTIDSGNAPAYNGRGNARTAKQDFDGAIADFTQAVKLDPSMAIAYDNRGKARSAKNDLEGAINDFTQAIGVDPTLASAFNDRGLARQSNGNLEGAVKDYTDALALQPKAARTYFNRGLARFSQGNLPAAILDFDHTVAIDPSIADAYFQRGNAKSARHDSDGAIADFTQTLTLNPKNALAYCSRGVAHEDKGELDKALADYTQALALDPKIAVAYFRRALIEVRQGNPDGAIADTSQSLDLDPKNTQAYYYRGFAKLLRGNFDGATSDFRLFCDAAPRDRFANNAHLYLWLVGKQQNNHTDPDQDLSDALENGWNNSADDFTAKTAAFLLGRVTESDYLTAATSSDADVNATQNCQAYYFAGMKRVLMGDRGTATDYFQKCVATGKKDFCEYILAQAALLQPPPAPAPVIPPATGPTPAPISAPSPTPAPSVPPTATPAVPVSP